MEIKDVTLEDAGKYKVIAKNDMGECSASISLNFDSKFCQLTTYYWPRKERFRSMSSLTQ